MKSYTVLRTIFSMAIIFFYSFGMEQEVNNKKLISLITKIKTQQNILGYTPTTEQLCLPEYFESAFEHIEGADPKEERTKIIQQLINREAISCINAIIYQHPLFEDRIRLILERFGNRSVFFLRMTIQYNEEQLKKLQLFEYYKQMTQKTTQNQQPTITPKSTSTSVRHKQPREIVEQLPQAEPKQNKLNFTETTYTTGLQYNYQGYLYWNNKNLECNTYDPFITVELNQFNDDGELISSQPAIPLPLPTLLNNEGIIKKEIILPLSKKPFIVNNKNTEALQKKLPDMAIKFYNNIDHKYNENDIEYLTEKNVIQKQGSSYIHGTNSCKPLLEEYFKLWDIPENKYKQAQEPVTETQPQEPTGWFATLQADFTRITTNIANFFKNIYRYLFG